MLNNLQTQKIHYETLRFYILALCKDNYMPTPQIIKFCEEKLKASEYQVRRAIEYLKKRGFLIEKTIKREKGGIVNYYKTNTEKVIIMEDEDSILVYYPDESQNPTLKVIITFCPYQEKCKEKECNPLTCEKLRKWYLQKINHFLKTTLTRQK